MMRKLVASLALALAVPAYANRVEYKLFDVGGDATAIAITPDGGAVWFTDAWGQKLGRLDTATGAVRTWPTPYQYQTPTDPYSGGGEAYDVLLDDAGDVWFSELPGRAGHGPAYVTRFEPATETFHQFMVNPAWWNGYGGSIWLGQGGLTKGPDGKIWFTDKSSPGVAGSVDPRTGAIESVAVAAPTWGSTDVVVSSTGKAYASSLYGGVWVVDPASGAATRLPAFERGTLGASDGSGNAWFSAMTPADVAAGSAWGLVRIADDGALTWFPAVSRPGMPGWFGHFAFDALGHLWFGQDYLSGATLNPELTELDPATGVVTKYALPIVPVYMTTSGDQLAASATRTATPGKIAVIVDLDRDDDGVMGKQDCNDRDRTIFPGATEVKRDGIDQDCNGYDLTIQVARATFKASSGILRVEATSALGAAAALQVSGIPGMKWDALTSRWILNVTKQTNPGTVRVCGIEGCDSPVNVVAQ